MSFYIIYNIIFVKQINLTFLNYYNIKNNCPLIKNSRCYEIHNEIYSSCPLDKYENIHFSKYCESLCIYAALKQNMYAHVR